MSTVLYTLFIWPIRVFIEAVFVLLQVLFNYRTGLSIIFLSLTVNTILLPIYAAADRWQKEDRDLMQRMKKKIADIKAVFKGEERRFILNTYYRQMGYSPLNSLKASMGVLLQIPFFLAAYQFLSHTASLRGQAFLCLKDLSRPDSLLVIYGYPIHVMPVLMTVINLLSAFVYSKKSERRERIQLFGMAFIFLILLYDSPSGLVLYWTVNNLFSLGKNLATRYLKHPAKVLQWGSAVSASLVILFVLSGLTALKPLYKYIVICIGLFVLAAPFLWRFVVHRVAFENILLKENKVLYFSSCAVMSVLLGILIPAQIIASSPAEFPEPWVPAYRTFLQSVSVCFLLPGLVWYLSRDRIRKLMAPVAVFIVILSVPCYFFLSGSYGTLTRGFVFDNPHRLRVAYPFWLNGIVICSALAAVYLFFRLRKIRVLSILLRGTFLSVLLMGIIAYYSAAREYSLDHKNSSLLNDGNDRSKIELFTFSKSNKNTFILFLDQAVSVAFYHALELLPETIKEMEGFIWYPKTLSFGDCTILGVPPLLGGYDYTPWSINARTNVFLKDKVNEALTLLPKLFGESGWRVAITDPSLANLQWIPDTSIYDGMPNVKARNIKGLFSKRFLLEKGYPAEKEIESFDFDIMFRYGLFRVALPALRYSIYYNGGWWRDGRSNSFDRSLAVFPNLYYLYDLCGTDDGPESLYIFMNESTHEYGAFTRDLLPSRDPVRYSQEEIKQFGSQIATGYAYVFLASLRSVGVFLKHLKELGVYDNTKIVISSDHGRSFPNRYFEVHGLERYNPLLLVKERNARGPLKISNEFMTQADVPAIVAKDLGLVKNPYTGKLINSEPKEREVLRVYEAPGNQNRHGPIGLTLWNSRKILHKDIYKASAWGEIEK